MKVRSVIRLINAICFLSLLHAQVYALTPAQVLEGAKTITHTVRQPFGGSQSPDDARIAAIARAKREALEMAGTYVQALTMVKDLRVEKDEILAITAGVVKAEIVSQKNYHTEDAFGIEVTVEVEVDTALLKGSVRKLLEDRTHLNQLKDSRAREKELLDKLARLEEENRQLHTSRKGSARLKKGFQETSRRLTAVDLLQKALDLWPVNEKCSDPRKAIGYIDKVLRLTPFPFAPAYVLRGMAYDDLGQHSRAIQDFDQALRLKPDDADTYDRRGMAYLGLKDYSRAIQDFDQALRLKPDDAKAYHCRGAAYFGLKDYSRAIQDFDQAIKINRQSAETWLGLGFAYDSLNRYDDAAEAHRQALKIEPENFAAWFCLGNAYAKLERYDDAAEAFRQAVRINPKDAKTWSNLGIAYDYLKRYDDAAEAYRQVVTINPKDAKTWSNLGRDYGGLERYDDAIKAFRQVVRINPKDADAWFRLAGAYFFSGNRAAALDAVRELRRFDPARADELFNVIVPR